MTNSILSDEDLKNDYNLIKDQDYQIQKEKDEK